MNWLDQIAPQINTVGSGGWNSGHEEPERSIFDHELVIFAAGKCTVMIKGKQYDSPARSWIIVPPGVIHKTVANQGSVHRHWIHFNWTACAPTPATPLCVYSPAVINRTLICSAPVFVPKQLFSGSLALESPIYKLLKTLESCWGDGNDLERTISRAVFLEILLRLLMPFSSTAGVVNRENELAYRVKDLLDQRPGPDISIRDLLASLGYSYEHLCRIFRRKFGVPPLAYLNSIRIETAKSLLRNSHLSIADIAYKTGFNNPAYFSRIFRRLTNTSPSKFQQ